MAKRSSLTRDRASAAHKFPRSRRVRSLCREFGNGVRKEARFRGRRGGRMQFPARTEKARLGDGPPGAFRASTWPPLYQFCQLSIRRRPREGRIKRPFEARQPRNPICRLRLARDTRAALHPRELGSQIRLFRGIESHPGKGSLIPPAFISLACLPRLFPHCPFFLFPQPLFTTRRLFFHSPLSFLPCSSSKGVSLHARKAIATKCSSDSVRVSSTTPLSSLPSPLLPFVRLSTLFSRPSPCSIHGRFWYRGIFFCKRILETL